MPGSLVSSLFLTKSIHSDDIFEIVDGYIQTITASESGRNCSWMNRDEWNYRSQSGYQCEVVRGILSTLSGAFIQL